MGKNRFLYRTVYQGYFKKCSGETEKIQMIFQNRLLKKVLCSLFVLISGMIFRISVSYGQETSIINIESADKSEYKKDELSGGDCIILTGSVKISVSKGSSKTIISSDKVNYNRSTEMLFAEGNVCLEQTGGSSGGEKITADSLLFNTSTLEGIFDNGSMDMLTLAMSELANISERRIYKLISGQRGLPSFLVAKPGLNSGFMIPQYTAASIVSQSKGLCFPASADSIPSSQGQEDHVSMGANAATKLVRVIENTEKVLAIELMNAAQALQFRRPLHSSPAIEQIFSDFRSVVPFVEDDCYFHPLIEKSIEFIRRA